MHIVEIQPQTWLAIFAALAAVVIAVVAIVLKRKNDNLRFILAELNTRQQHQSWDPPSSEASAAVEAAPQPPAVEPAAVEPPEPQAAPEPTAVEPPAAELLAVAEPVAAPVVEAPIETPAPTGAELAASSLSSHRAEERAIEFASRQGRRRHPGPTPDSLPRLDDASNREALSEWLNKRAAARAARKTAPEIDLSAPPGPEAAAVAEPIPAEPSHSVAAVTQPNPEPAPLAEPSPESEAAAAVEPTPTEPSHTEQAAEPEVAAVAQPIPEPAPVADGSPEPEEAVVAEPTPELVLVAELIPEPEQAVVAEPVPTPAPIIEQAVEQPVAEEPRHPAVFIDESLWESILGQSQAVKQAPETAPSPRFELIQGAAMAFPSGLHDETVLRRLLETNKPFHGLAVALGFTLTGGRAMSEDLMLHIEELVRSLLQDNDFACQTGENEFLLLLPGKHGSEAQKRMSAISERLWDFQLRGAGNFSIMVNTGDAQISGEPLSAASVAASARLRQARRARKPVSVAARKSISAVV